MAPRMRFELMSPADTGFQDQRLNPGLATSASNLSHMTDEFMAVRMPFKLHVVVNDKGGHIHWSRVSNIMNIQPI